MSETYARTEDVPHWGGRTTRQPFDYRDALELRVRNLESEIARLQAEAQQLRNQLADREVREASDRMALDKLYPAYQV